MEHIEAIGNINKRKIRECINDQQSLETKMAKNIVKIFNKNFDLIGPLRGLVMNSIDNMEYLVGSKGECVLKKAFIDDARHYGFVKKANPPGHLAFYDENNFLEKMKGKVDYMSAVECSDMIRFYGEVVENGSKCPKLSENRFDVIKRRSNELGPLPDKMVSGFVELNEKRMSYQKDSKHMGWWKKKGEEKNAKRLREKVSNADATLLNAYEKNRTVAERAVLTLNGGISRWIQLPGDLGNKINRVFGLQKGATISGTTTDTIFFLNKMTMIDIALKDDGYVHDYYYGDNGPQGLDPIYYLLPLATLVSEGHHTVVEVTLPLSLNGIITEYRIGKYTTLMPERKGRSNDGADKINELLKKYEKESKRMLIYYGNDGKIAGGVFFEEGDKAIWDEISVANEKLMGKIAAFPPRPKKKDIGSLHQNIKDKFISDKTYRFIR